MDGVVGIASVVVVVVAVGAVGGAKMTLIKAIFSVLADTVLLHRSTTVSTQLSRTHCSFCLDTTVSTMAAYLLVTRPFLMQHLTG